MRGSLKTAQIHYKLHYKSDLFGVDKSTVCWVFHHVVRTICDMKSVFIAFPSSDTAINQTKAELYAIAGTCNTVFIVMLCLGLSLSQLGISFYQILGHMINLCGHVTIDGKQNNQPLNQSPFKSELTFFALF